MKRLLKVMGWLVLLGVVAVVALYVVLRHSPAEVTAGPEADALAHEIENNIDAGAWGRTRAVRWKAKGGREHLWDRDRNYARVRFGNHEVLLDLSSKNGRAWTGGVEIRESKAQRKLLDAAYKWHINDAFWLNPLVKLFDGGTTRSLGKMPDGKRVLQVAYASGGVTPGDRYQWIVGATGRPERWRVWVQVLPVPGMEFSWEGWSKLPTGAWISNQHNSIGLTLVSSSEVAAAATFAELEPGPDPFAPISTAAPAK